MKTTFKTFLESTSYSSFEVLVNAIRNNCGNYLDATQPGQVLYRGMRSVRRQGAWGFQFGPVENRKPRDSSKELDAVFDILGEKYLGIPQWRRSAYFCAASTGGTHVYGDTFLIYPIGNPTYSWSKKYYDLTDTFGGSIKNLAAEYYPDEYFSYWDWRDHIANGGATEFDMQMLDLIGEDFKKSYTVKNEPTPEMYKSAGDEIIVSHGKGHIAVDILGISVNPPPELQELITDTMSVSQVVKEIDSYIRNH